MSVDFDPKIAERRKEKMKKIIYKNPNEIENFDLKRFVKSISRYAKVSEKEVKEIYQLVEECAVQLEAEGKKYRVPEQGVMIETPAAVMISDRLAKQVDFFSIGTNDLAQYTLALDRQNESMDDFYDPHHEAVLRMIEMTVANAHAAGKRVGICGELAADISLPGRFASMGVDELSVAPAMILKIRKKLGELCVKDEKNGMDAWFTH